MQIWTTKKQLWTKKNNYLDEDLKSYRDCKDESESDSNEDDDERKSDIYNDE